MKNPHSANRRPSIREVAKLAEVSPITASRALRGSPLVREELRVRVAKAAEKLGYSRNPLTGALMSEIRRSQSGAFQGVLAVLDLDGPENRDPGAASYHQEIMAGATARAKELGFVADFITAEKVQLSVGRLDRILHARGISGLFLLPVRELPDLTRLDWNYFSGIYADYVIERPGLHTICPDHYRAILTALEHLRLLGYRQPGLVLNGFHNARVLHRFASACHAYQTNHEDMEYCPPLVMWQSNEKDFSKWFRGVKCDVVVAHRPEVIDWMQNAGARVPDTHGFCCLNLKNASAPCAGLDLQPRLIGERGMELLIGMVLRNERGVPAHPMATLTSPRWVDGPTLRRLDDMPPIPQSGIWKWAPPANRKHGEYPSPDQNVVAWGSASCTPGSVGARREG